MDLQALEDWLVAASAPISNAQASVKQARTPAPAARQIAEVWGQLRACVQKGMLEPAHAEALFIIDRHHKSLHVAESQAKLLLALLTTVKCNNIELLGQARASSALVLIAWVRKTFVSTSASPSKQAGDALVLLVESVCKSLQELPVSDIYVCQTILLLGVVCIAPQVSNTLRHTCQQVISQELTTRKLLIVQGELSIVLAGVGYAMTMAHGSMNSLLLQSLLSLWNPTHRGHETRQSECPPFREALMLFHLLEYQGLAFSSKKSIQAVAEVTTIVNEITLSTLETSPPATQCAALMAAAGVRRGLHSQMSSSISPVEQETRRLILSLDFELIRVCEETVRSLEKIKSFSYPGEEWDLCTLKGITSTELTLRHKLQCIALAVARSRGVPPHPSILQCMLATLLADALSLHVVYSAQLEDLQLQFLKSRETGCALGVAMELLEKHVANSLFLEVGGIARAMCEQYKSASEDLQNHTELLVWQFTQDLNASHRIFTALNGRQMQRETGALEKVLVSSFMMVLVFFSRAIEDDNHRLQTVKPITGEKAARALDCLSCVEFCRYVQMQDYGSLVERCVSHVSAHQVATRAFVGFLPAYNSILYWPGPPELNNRSYIWSRDEILTARMSFYLRVLPSFLFNLPEVIFANDVAPTMFLYLQHPVEPVANASHSLFAYFLALEPSAELAYKNEASESDTPEATLREKLSIYYVRRAIETFPGVTPFDALVFGVAAITKVLPPGSPATLHCIHLLVQKALSINPMGSDVLSRQSAKDGRAAAQRDLDELGDAEKLPLLLLHLIRRVDLQVLPELLKQTAQLILGLPPQARTSALENAFEIVAGSSDYMRKPIVIPWLQSLAYLSTNPRALTSIPNKNCQSISLEKQNVASTPEISPDGDSLGVKVSQGLIAINPSNAACRAGWDRVRLSQQRTQSSL